MPGGSLSYVDAVRTDLSFQILHAKYAIEKMIGEFTQRAANFEIVFWDGQWFFTTRLVAHKYDFRFRSPLLYHGGRRCLCQNLANVGKNGDHGAPAEARHPRPHFY